jgi:hypothetical protein
VFEKIVFEKRWQLASSEQRARYNNLLFSYPLIDWTNKEKKYRLWLCQLDIDTFEIFEVILDKIKNSAEDINFFRSIINGLSHTHIYIITMTRNPTLSWDCESILFF